MTTAPGATQVDVPDEVRARLEQLADAYSDVSLKETSVRRRMQTRTARIRSAIGEVVDRYSARIVRIKRKRAAVVKEILDLWNTHAPGAKQLVLPAGTVRRRTNTAATTRNKRAVIDTLDRLDRLDVVEETVNERKLATVVRDNRDKFPEGSVDFVETPTIALYRKEEDDAAGA